jgi:hypothetical protein
MNQKALIQYLSEVRGCPVGQELSTASFYRWLDVCCVVPKGRLISGYTQQEVARLAALAQHLSLGGGYKEFKAQLIEQEKHNAYQDPTERTIECECVEA